MEVSILDISVHIPLAEGRNAHVPLRPDTDSVRRMAAHAITLHQDGGVSRLLTATPGTAPVFLRFFGDLSADQNALSAHANAADKGILIAIEVDGMGRLSRETAIVDSDARFDQRVQMTVQVAPTPTGLPIVRCDVPPFLTHWTYLFSGQTQSGVTVQDAAGLVGFEQVEVPSDLPATVYAAWHSDKVLSVADHFGVRAQAVTADGRVIGLPRRSLARVIKVAGTDAYTALMFVAV